MRDFLARLSWPVVAVVGLALAALVGVVALLAPEARSEAVLALISLASVAAVGAGALPSAVRPRPSQPPPSSSASQDITRPVRVSSVPPRGEP